MALRTLTAQKAAALDAELMSAGGFSIDQLMELAGLSVSQAAHTMLPPTRGKNILILCGPGNNGGDGLVAARHLKHYRYDPVVYYPKPTKGDLFQRLVTQLEQLDIPFADTPSLPQAFERADLVVDAVFGFSFKGEVREPFREAIALLARHSRDLSVGEGENVTPTPLKQILAVDAPSSWNIDDGPPADGPGAGYHPSALISLTAPKPLVKFYTRGRHFVGGRFLGEDVARRFDIDVPDYTGLSQVTEVPVGDGNHSTGGKI